jgi:hypothetical protein
MTLMRPHVRIQLTIAAGLLAVVLAAPAEASTVTANNACLYSFNNEYRTQLVTLGGAGSPVGAPAGAVATLSGASISATLPPSLPQQGYALGIFQPGFNAIPAQVWIAIAASNAEPATQVFTLSVTTATTIEVDGAGAFVSGTPIVVTIPIPDSSWTVTGAGPVVFSQAPPGTLPALPVGLSDAVVPVAGSIVVKPTLGTLRFVLDCQPGTTESPFQTFAAAAAEPFATLESDAPVAPVVAPALKIPPRSKPSFATTRPKVAGGRASVTIACTKGKSSCTGRVALKSAAPVRVAGRARVLQVAPGASYSVPPGQRRAVKLRLSAGARALLRTRRTLRVQATLLPAAGLAIKRQLTLSR